MPIATMILDPDLTPIDASAAALELIGATIDELRRLPPGGLAAEADAAGSAIALRDTWKASGTPELGGEITIRRLDGRRVRVRFGLTPLDDGRFLAILEPVATPVERPDVIYTAGQVLAEWRAAERRMHEVPPDSPEGRRIRADIEVFRARYQDVFRSNAARPPASTTG